MTFLWTLVWGLFLISAGLIGYSMGYNNGLDDERFERYQKDLEVISQFIDID